MGKSKGKRRPPTLAERKCVICGAVFAPKCSAQKCCSPKCSRERKRNVTRENGGYRRFRGEPVKVVHADTAPRKVVRGRLRDGRAIRVEYRGTCAAGPRCASADEVVRRFY